MDVSQVDDIFTRMRSASAVASTVPSTANQIENQEQLLILSSAQRKQLTSARVSMNMKREDLAKKARVRVDLVNAIESGKPIQDKTALPKINKALGLSLLFTS